jgi:hypothetical protein
MFWSLCQCSVRHITSTCFNSELNSTSNYVILFLRLQIFWWRTISLHCLPFIPLLITVGVILVASSLLSIKNHFLSLPVVFFSFLMFLILLFLLESQLLFDHCLWGLAIYIHTYIHTYVHTHTHTHTYIHFF